MAVPEFTARVYDRATGHLLKVLGVVRQFQTAQYWNAIGSFGVTVPINQAVSDDRATLGYLARGNLLEIWRDDAYLIGGPIRERQMARSGTLDMLTVSGPSYLTWLRDRLILPADPASDTYDTASSDRADNVVKGYIRRHLSAPTRTERTISPTLTVEADIGVSQTTLTYSGRYETVLDAAQAIADQAGDFQFDIVRETSGLLTFRTWSPRKGEDRALGATVGIGRTRPTIFDADATNLALVERIESASAVANYIFVGGQGEGTARTIVERSDSSSIVADGRIEEFLDARNDATTALLRQRGDEALANHGLAADTLTFVVGGGGTYTWGVDFDFGDQVSAIYGDVLVSDTVAAVEASYSVDNPQEAQLQLRVTLSVRGVNVANPRVRLGRLLGDLGRGISTLARR